VTKKVLKDFPDNTSFVQMFIFVDDLGKTNQPACCLSKSVRWLLCAGKAEIFFGLIKSAPWCCPFSARGRDFLVSLS